MTKTKCTKKSLQKENEELKRDLFLALKCLSEARNEEKGRLENINDELQTENDQLVEAVQSMMEEAEELLNENRQLQEKIKKLESNNNELVIERDSLFEQWHSRSKRGNCGMTIDEVDERLEQVRVEERTRLSRIIGEKERLQQTLAQVQKQKDEMEAEVDRLRDLILVTPPREVIALRRRVELPGSKSDCKCESKRYGTWINSAKGLLLIPETTSVRRNTVAVATAHTESATTTSFSGNEPKLRSSILSKMPSVRSLPSRPVMLSAARGSSLRDFLLHPKQQPDSESFKDQEDRKVGQSEITCNESLGSTATLVDDKKDASSKEVSEIICLNISQPVLNEDSDAEIADYSLSKSGKAFADGSGVIFPKRRSLSDDEGQDIELNDILNDCSDLPLHREQRQRSKPVAALDTIYSVGLLSASISFYDGGDLLVGWDQRENEMEKSGF